MADGTEIRCARCGLGRYYIPGETADGAYTRENGAPGFVNDAGDKCTDCQEKDPPYTVGTVVFVRAWWNNQKPVKCAVVSAPVGYKLITVQPLEGNPHQRSIRATEIIQEKPDYRSEFSQGE